MRTRAGEDGDVGNPAPSHDALVDRAAQGDAGVGIDLLDDPGAFLDAMSRAWGEATREVCSVLPAGPYSTSVMRSSWNEDSALSGRGIAGRVIYQADAVRTPEMLRYVTELVGTGVQARVAVRTQYRLLIVDRSQAFVATRPDTLELPYLRVREPALVRSFCVQFAALWRSAHAVGIGPEDPLAEERVREILRVLAAGATDELAAKQLGLSARTVRRRVAAVLDLFGAHSRFEAGVKATHSGWL